MNCKNCGAPIGRNGYCGYCSSFYPEVEKENRRTFETQAKGNKDFYVNGVEGVSVIDYNGKNLWGISTVAAASALSGIITLG